MSRLLVGVLSLTLAAPSFVLGQTASRTTVLATPGSVPGQSLLSRAWAQVEWWPVLERQSATCDAEDAAGTGGLLPAFADPERLIERRMTLTAEALRSTAPATLVRAAGHDQATPQPPSSWWERNWKAVAVVALVVCGFLLWGLLSMDFS